MRASVCCALHKLTRKAYSQTAEGKRSSLFSTLVKRKSDLIQHTRHLNLCVSLPIFIQSHLHPHKSCGSTRGSWGHTTRLTFQGLAQQRHRTSFSTRLIKSRLSRIVPMYSTNTPHSSTLIPMKLFAEMVT